MLFFDGGVLPHQRRGGLGHGAIRRFNLNSGLGADYNKGGSSRFRAGLLRDEIAVDEPSLPVFT